MPNNNNNTWITWDLPTELATATWRGGTYNATITYTGADMVQPIRLGAITPPEPKYTPRFKTGQTVKVNCNLTRSLPKGTRVVIDRYLYPGMVRVELNDGTVGWYEEWSEDYFDPIYKARNLPAWW